MPQLKKKKKINVWNVSTKFILELLQQLKLGMGPQLLAISSFNGDSLCRSIHSFIFLVAARTVLPVQGLLDEDDAVFEGEPGVLPLLLPCAR